MQITDVTQHHVENLLPDTFNPVWIPGYPEAIHEAEVFEIETDEGITGYTASPSFAGGFDMEDKLNLLLVGIDPYDIERFYEKLETIDLLGPRPWHLEIALWDIMGKDAGQPVYRLLGGDNPRGKTDGKLKAYASTAENQEVERRLDYIEERVREGFEAVKLRFGRREIEEDLEVARRVRREFPELTLMVDPNMGWSARVMEIEERWSFNEALEVCRGLEEIGGVEWIEEPLEQHAYRPYSELREKTDIAVAGGELNSGIYEFREFLEHGSLDVLQPDVMMATGLKRGKEVADMAALHGVEFAPHTWTNGLGLLANLHLMAATHAEWCEYPIEPPAWVPGERDFFLSDPIDHENGYISPPDQPGLGTEINLE
ncbi:MAG: mandelate racemase/muconate lactonizing enzyme family protein [Halobacteria archaeon]